eukprot:gene12362-biopygen6438
MPSWTMAGWFGRAPYHAPYPPCQIALPVRGMWALHDRHCFVAALPCSQARPCCCVRISRGHRTLARAWRGHGAVARPVGIFFGLGGAGVARVWRGRGNRVSRKGETNIRGGCWREPPAPFGDATPEAGYCERLPDLWVDHPELSLRHAPLPQHCAQAQQPSLGCAAAAAGVLGIAAGDGGRGMACAQVEHVAQRVMQHG